MIRFEDDPREGAIGTRSDGSSATTPPAAPPVPAAGDDAAGWRHVAEVRRRALAGGLESVHPLLAAVEAWPDDAETLGWGARLCLKARLLPEATALWRRALARAEAPDAWAGLARVALAEGDLPRARDAVARALALTADHGEAWLAQGVLALQEQRHATAVAAFEGALRRGADARRARLGMVMAGAAGGDVERAWHVLAGLVLEHPHDAEVVYWLLRVGAARGSWVELLAPLERYLARRPDDASVRFALAGVLLRCGRADEARAHHEHLRTTAADLEGLDALARSLAEPAPTPLAATG